MSYEVKKKCLKGHFSSFSFVQMISNMRTKSILWSMMTVTMTAMLSMSLTACGGGDDDSSSPTPGTDGLDGQKISL